MLQSSHMSKPTVLIITGGASSRLFPLNVHNKGYLTVQGKTLLARTIQNFIDHGFSNIVVVGPANDPNGELLASLLHQDGINHPVQFVTQTEPRGQADAILAAKAHLEGDFIVCTPYHFLAGEISEQLTAKKQATGAECVYVGTPTSTPEHYGMISFDGDHFQHVVEKPAPGQEPSNIKMVALYLFTHSFLHTLEATPAAEYALEDAITKHAAEHFDTFLRIEDSPLSLKYAWQVFDFHHHFFRQLHHRIDSSAKIAQTAILDESRGAIVVEAGARIGDFVKIVGPAYIGRETLVGDYSFVRESSLEKGATVGANTELVRSIVLEEATVHFGYVADSIIGTQAKIGAGLITANKRLDRNNVMIEIKGKNVDVGRNNLGVIVGDHANIGIGVNTMPGVLIGPRATIFPGTTLYKSVPADTVFK